MFHQEWWKTCSALKLTITKTVYVKAKEVLITNCLDKMVTVLKICYEKDENRESCT